MTIVIGKTLGACAFECGKARLTPTSDVSFAALLYLASQAGRPCTRAELIALLWPEATEAEARHCLRQTIYRLRKLGVPLSTEDDELRIPKDDVELDHAVFSSSRAPLEILTSIRPASYLPLYAPTFSSYFAEWVESQRALIHGRMRRVLLAAISDLRSRGAYRDVESLSRQCLEFDPLNYDATHALAESVAVLGSQGDAIHILDRYLDDVGPGDSTARTTTLTLRRRIAERVAAVGYTRATEALLVGRDRELSELTAALLRARGNEAGSVLIWGDAGIGKTRLAAEFLRAAAVHGVRCERIRCHPVDVDRPLSMFVDLVPRLMNYRGALGVAPDSMLLLRRITDLDAPSDSASHTEVASVVHDRICRAIVDLVDAIASESTLLLFVDDAHWLDATSWRVLAEVLRRCSTRRLLILLATRAHKRSQSVDNSAFLYGASQLLHLLPLDDASSLELIDALLRRQATSASEEVRNSCIRKGAGNPLFLTELATHSLAKIPYVSLPSSLRALLEERISNLSSGASRLFQVVALLGRAATLDRIEVTLALAPHALIDACDELQQLGLLTVEDGLLVSRHELLATEAIEQLGSAAQLVLHRRIAATLEQEIAATRSASLLWECAGHWRRAGSPRRVMDIARMCADQLVLLGTPREAMEVVQQSLSFAVDEQQRESILSHLSQTAKIAGEWGVVRNSLRLLRALSQAAARPVWPGHHADYVEALFRTNTEPAETASEALAFARDQSLPAAERLRATSMLLALADNLGDSVLANDANEICTSIASSQAGPGRIESLCALFFHSTFGDLAHATRFAEAILEMSESANEPMQLCRDLRYASIPYVYLGDDHIVRAYFERGYSLALQGGMWGEAWSTADYGAHNAFKYGDLNDAGRWLDRLREAGSKGDFGPYMSAVLHSHSTRFALRSNAGVDHALAAAESFRYADLVSLPRPRLHFLTLGCDVLTSAGALVPEDRLAELSNLSARFRRLGDQDYSVAILARHYRSLGEDSMAENLIRQYVREDRREMYPVREVLQQETKSARIQ